MEIRHFYETSLTGVFSTNIKYSDLHNNNEDGRRQILTVWKYYIPSHCFIYHFLKSIYVNTFMGDGIIHYECLFQFYNESEYMTLFLISYHNL